MVALPQTYNVDEIKTTPSNKVVVPDGTYIGVILTNEMSKSPYGDNKPDDLLLRVAITEGEYKDTILDHRLSIMDETPINADNPTFTWARAAYGTIGQIADAFGMVNTPSDVDELCNKPLAFTTSTRKGKDKQTGQYKPEWDESYIKSYKAIDKASVSQAAAQSNQEVEPAKVEPPAGGNPFA